jgi:hypothetical protein
MEASTRGAAEAETPAARGTIGRQTFELAHELIRDGKKPTEAFALVASSTGRSAATVATAYYRIARTVPGGAGVKQRAPRGRSVATAPPSARGGETRRSGTTTSELVRQLVDAAAALGQHVERLERENAEYRKIAAALERIR